MGGGELRLVFGSLMFRFRIPAQPVCVLTADLQMLNF